MAVSASTHRLWCFHMCHFIGETLSRNLPHLWSSISVTVTEADWVDLLRHYIGTSKDWPLKVFVQQNGPLKAVAASQGAAVLRLLMSQAFRFRELVMTLDNWTILGRLKELDVTFPSLTSFRIRTETTDALEPEYRWLWHAMMRAPQLQMVKTDSWRTYPYQQLRSLEIEKWTDVLSKGFGYLQQCGQLESLTIQRFCPEDDVAVSVNLGFCPISLPRFHRRRNPTTNGEII
ncbi:hypothetical protein VNI00_014652 [Paramarasmius palmivorus]|uniref:Uncharacterized protein n=1 Tax=Paramarasmius palmivorus TaxID=297713 RepID=A0AAW0BT38_9AGAR